MVKRKFTVFLMPLDEGGYQVFFPYYPNCVTDGLTIEAFNNAKDAMEGILQAEAKNGGRPGA
jgi:predicted RNase H-like HicB family nuclease